MDARAHWDAIYRAKAPEQLTWFQAEPRTSLALIQRAVPDPASSVIDVGGGASRLVDGLVRLGYDRVSVLDVSPSALAASRQRLGPAADHVTWIEADVLTAGLPRSTFDLWHDRAVFHFLTAPTDRAGYVDQVRRALKPGGHVVIATFAEDGPTRCSGLPVVRYTAEALQQEFGPEFVLVDSLREVHVTPSGGAQAFTHVLLRRDAARARS
jgi:SAM-dependent methyltransferase